ncbi:GSCOCG00009320001-RA-CDS [Cotesia congregata]|nr:GSCOCG00009320001-RA-CDS [Cotesia congregata]
MHQRLKVEGVLGFDCRHSASQETYIDSEHGRYFKVPWMRIKTERKRRSRNISNPFHEPERNQRKNSCCNYSIRILFSVQMQNMPASSPSIDTAEPEDRRVDPRPEVVKKTMLVRVQKIIQKMLNYVEEK